MVDLIVLATYVIYGFAIVVTCLLMLEMFFYVRDARKHRDYLNDEAARAEKFMQTMRDKLHELDEKANKN